MRTSEVAQRAGVNTETLRYYERRGLLAEPPRTPGGYRDYPTEAVRMLRFVKRSQALGFSLAEVEDLLQLAEGGPESRDRARDLADGHLVDLDRRIAELQRMRAALVDLVDSCARPRQDRLCPLLEPLQDERIGAPPMTAKNLDELEGAIIEQAAAIEAAETVFGPLLRHDVAP